MVFGNQKIAGRNFDFLWSEIERGNQKIARQNFNFIWSEIERLLGSILISFGFRGWQEVSGEWIQPSNGFRKSKDCKAQF